MIAILFLIISLLSLLFLYHGTGRNKRLLLYFIVWQIIVGILAYLRVFMDSPILFPFVILATFLFLIYGIRAVTIKHITTNYLLANHVLRIPVELILYQLYLEGVIPKLMTYEGYNFDIVIGISALIILGYQLLTNRKLKPTFIWLWNIIGIVFLLFIVTLAILSSPLPIQQLAFDQPNVALLMFTYCFLPTCVVPIVLLSHLLWLKKNALKNTNL